MLQTGVFRRTLARQLPAWGLASLWAFSLQSVFAAGLEIMAELEQGPGNIAVTPDGRLIVSQHQFYDPEYRVVEVLPSGDTRPFPNEEWSKAPAASGIGMHAVLGIRSDANGVVWMLDNGGAVPKLIAWDTQSDRLARVIHSPPPATIDGSFHNDLAVDTLHQAIFIADIGPGPKRGAIVVVDLRTGLSRRVLEGHSSTSAEDVAMRIDGTPVRMLDDNGQPFEPRVAINPISIDPSYTWVYYGAMHGTSLYRIQTRDLLNENLSAGELAERVVRYGDKPVSDGISVDTVGNVYITDVTRNAIGVTGSDGSYHRLFADDERLSWPDGISTGPDGYMYVTVNRLHRSAALNAGKNASKPPYYVVRFRPLAPGTVGR